MPMPYPCLISALCVLRYVFCTAEWRGHGYRPPPTWEGQTKNLISARRPNIHIFRGATCLLLTPSSSSKTKHKMATTTLCKAMQTGRLLKPRVNEVVQSVPTQLFVCNASIWPCQIPALCASTHDGALHITPRQERFLQKSLPLHSHKCAGKHSCRKETFLFLLFRECCTDAQYRWGSYNDLQSLQKFVLTGAFFYV